MTTSVKTTKVYDEIIDLIAARTTPQGVIVFYLSATAGEQLEDLAYKHQIGELTPEEKKEFDDFLVLEHIMTLAKARAYKYIKAE